jgi:hypothetical protein
VATTVSAVVASCAKLDEDIMAVIAKILAVFFQKVI